MDDRKRFPSPVVPVLFAEIAGKSEGSVSVGLVTLGEDHVPPGAISRRSLSSISVRTALKFAPPSSAMVKVKLVSGRAPSTVLSPEMVHVTVSPTEKGTSGRNRMVFESSVRRVVPLCAPDAD